MSTGKPYAVAHMKLRKKGSLSGLQIHNDRKTNNHSNPEIDITKKSQNYDLVKNSGTYREDIMGYIDENNKNRRAIRSDANVVCDWIISASPELFDTLAEDRTKEYFEAAVEFYQDRYGKDNVRFATVHMDETTPHMHLGVVPFDENNVLTSKKLMTRTELRSVQTDLVKHLQGHDFDVQRGKEGSRRRNLSVPEYKATMDHKKEVEAENKRIERSNEVIKDENAHLDEVNEYIKDQYERLKDDWAEQSSYFDNRENELFELSNELMVKEEQQDRTKSDLDKRKAEQEKQERQQLNRTLDLANQATAISIRYDELKEMEEEEERLKAMIEARNTEFMEKEQTKQSLNTAISTKNNELENVSSTVKAQLNKYVANQAEIDKQNMTITDKNIDIKRLDDDIKLGNDIISAQNEVIKVKNDNIIDETAEINAREFQLNLDVMDNYEVLFESTGNVSVFNQTAEQHDLTIIDYSFSEHSRHGEPVNHDREWLLKQVDDGKDTIKVNIFKQRFNDFKETITDKFKDVQKAFKQSLDKLAENAMEKHFDKHFFEILEEIEPIEYQKLAENKENIDSPPVQNVRKDVMESIKTANDWSEEGILRRAIQGEFDDYSVPGLKVSQQKSQGYGVDMP